MDIIKQSYNRIRYISLSKKIKTRIVKLLDMYDIIDIKFGPNHLLEPDDIHIIIISNSFQNLTPYRRISNIVDILQEDEMFGKYFFTINPLTEHEFNFKRENYVH